MIKKILISSLAVGALALNAPVALADPPTDYDCSFAAVQQADATGQNFEGTVVGYAVHAEASPVSIRCYVTVNDVPAPGGSTPTGTSANGGVAVTGGPVSYEALEGQVVKLCAEATTHGDTYTVCAEATGGQVPPQEVLDLLDEIIQAVLDLTFLPDPILCPLLQQLGGLIGGGIPGVLEIDAEGDVEIADIPFWDCPIYGS